ncbi:MAG TPA: tetratricopeptide repeat protein [Gemmataceae bacterium]|jgi:tetratricopeptide (TPR) repeat protein|nr:tetratricopeptide repeat protein [Gemmataceae bacterium]
MGKRVGWLLLAGICLGCSMLHGLPVDRQAPENDPESQQNTPSAPVEDSLRLAAACLESGDDGGALPHLQAYLAAHPDHAVIRAHLGELLLRLHKRSEARQEFEHYLLDAANQGDLTCRHVIHCHSRLAEIARDEHNAYEERLHRGIGLYLLARQVSGPAAKDDDPDPEQLLFKAIRQLEQAVKERPKEARPHWYLYLAWSHLGQMHPAREHLQKACQFSEPADLPADEFVALQAAR